MTSDLKARRAWLSDNLNRTAIYFVSYSKLFYLIKVLNADCGKSDLARLDARKYF